jgi:hypothetical protein
VLPGAQGIDEFDVDHLGALLLGHFDYALGGTHVGVVSLISLFLDTAVPAGRQCPVLARWHQRLVLGLFVSFLTLPHGCWISSGKDASEAELRPATFLPYEYLVFVSLTAASPPR